MTTVRPQPSGLFEITVGFRVDGDRRRARRCRRARGTHIRRDVGRSRRPRPSPRRPRLRRGRVHGRGRPRGHRQGSAAWPVGPHAHLAGGTGPDPADPRHHRHEWAHTARGVRPEHRRPGRRATVRRPPRPGRHRPRRSLRRPRPRRRRPNSATIDAALRLVTLLAGATVEGADGVSVTLERNGRLSTVASTNDTVRLMDDHQYATGEGPCLAAAAQGHWFHSESLAEEDRWPAFVPRAPSKKALPASSRHHS